MNLYILVEGRRTEVKVYPGWLAHLLPRYTRVRSCDDARENNYFLISGEGYPSLLQHLENAVEDVRRSGRYRYLLLCLDADELSVQERQAEIYEYLRVEGISLGPVDLRIIVQNRCIETWFLGNRKALTRAPQSAALRRYIDFHDVSQVDPEQMGCYPGFRNHADYHGAYLREMLWERGVSYTKEYPRHVTDVAYLEQLLLRTRDCPDDLRSLQTFLRLCDEISADAQSYRSATTGQ